MGVYLLFSALVVGIPFLLYCLWNFSREIKPRKASAFFSAVPTLGSIQATPVSRQTRQNPWFNPGTSVVQVGIPPWKISLIQRTAIKR
jgi:hypothetical protein